METTKGLQISISEKNRKSSVSGEYISTRNVLNSDFVHSRRLENKLLQIEEASDEFKRPNSRYQKKFLRAENKTTHKLYILFYL